MTSRKLSLRLRRSYRRSRRQVEDMGSQAGEGLEQHLIARFSRLLNVQRFIAVWVSLLILLTATVFEQTRALGGYYQTPQPVAGGTYTEGILGDFTNANPLYATSPVDSAVSRLVFAGLFTYNDQNQLVGDLAKDWSVDATGRIYTVHLKPHLTWQDGQPLTADDVVFTYNVIQNPDAQSPLNASWQGVVMTANDPLTVTFTLPNVLSAFPYSLTNGIVPKHLLGTVPAFELRSAAFNTFNPVGAGPFSWRTIQVLGASPETRQEEIALRPFSHYHGGAPKLDSFVIRSFHNQDQFINSFRHNELDAMAGLSAMPDTLTHDANLQTYSFPLTDESMIFFKTSTGVLSDTKVRQALVMAADTSTIIKGLGYPVIPVREPFLIHQIGYDPSYQQLAFSPEASIKLLHDDGWLPGKNNLLYKNNQSLTFNLYASDTPNSKNVVNALQQAWEKVGVNVHVIVQNPSDTQNTVTYHNYDAMLYNISIGVDPDVFVYWHSSQADLRSPTRLNFSEYKSSAADKALEAGRTRSDPSLRAIKYKPFLAAWQQDAPALGLYQPRFLYITRETVYGLSDHSINAGTDRFNNVQNWEIRTANVTD